MTTVGDVLASDPIRRGRPVILTGEDRLATPVRWVHVSEHREVGALLDGAEVVLTTGWPLRDPRDALYFVKQLIVARASALIVELGDALPAVPQQALRCAADAGLVVVALRRKVRFIEVTQAVHRDLVSDQLAQLQFSAKVHDTFTSLGLRRAGIETIVSAAAELMQGPTVLENRNHQVVAMAGGEREGLVSDWARRSRAAATAERTATVGPEDWLTTPVGLQGRIWGRLIAPECRDVGRAEVVLERAAQALEMQRMIEVNDVAAESRVHRRLLSALVDGRFSGANEASARLLAVGLPRAAEYQSVLVVFRGEQLQDEIDIRRLMSRHNVDGLTAAMSDREIRIVVAVSDGSARQVDDFIQALASRGTNTIVAVASRVHDLDDIGTSLQETDRIARVALLMPPGPTSIYRSSDLRLPGLVYALREDDRLAHFVEDELGALLARDLEGGDKLLPLLREYLECGGNMAELARRVHRNRSALYRTVRRLQALLPARLDDPSSRTSLAVAVMAHDALSQGRDREARQLPR